MDAELHAWRIEEREHARQEERRGRRHAFETLAPPRTALVVIDMLPLFAAGSSNCRGIVPNITALAAALRAVGGTVAWVVPAEGDRMIVSEEFYGPQVTAAHRRSGGAGPVRNGLWQGLDAPQGDLLSAKAAVSAFFAPDGCPLPGLLEERSITTVLITGTVTNVCCESSARDASTLGFRVIMAARRDADHNATLHTIYRSFGDVAMIESATA